MNKKVLEFVSKQCKMTIKMSVSYLYDIHFDLIDELMNS